MTHYKKIAALDLGDQWIGIALSDTMHIIATPFHTVQTSDLKLFLQTFITEQQVGTIVVGMPITVRGNESEQTKKTKTMLSELQQSFPTMHFVTIDERFSSKQASDVQKTKKKGTLEKIKAEKLKNHAIAAAFILDTYLQRLRFEREYAQTNE